MPRNRFVLNLRERQKPFVLYLRERSTNIKAARERLRRKPVEPERFPAYALLPKPSYKGVGFTGTRDGLKAKQSAAIKKQLVLLLDRNDHIFRHGDCVGADAALHKFAKANNAYIVIYPPLNKTLRAFCEKAQHVCKPDDYIARNHKIVEHAAVLLAAPSSKTEEQRSGTWATIRYARKLRRPIYIVFPDGSTSAEIPGLTF